MKHLSCQLWARALAFVLCVLFAALAALSAYGAYYAYDEGWLHGQGGFARSQICRNEVMSELRLVAYGLQDHGLTRDFADALGDSEVFTYVVKDADGHILLDTRAGDDELSWGDYNAATEDEQGRQLLIDGYVSQPYSRSLYFARAYAVYDLVYGLSRAYIPLAVGCGLLAILLFCFLMLAVGRRETETGCEIVVRGLHRWPLEVFLAGCALPLLIGWQMHDLGYSSLMRLILFSATLVLLLTLALAVCCTLAVRIKSGSLWHNTLLRRGFTGLSWLFRCIGQSKRLTRWLVLGYLLFMIALFIIVSGGDNFWILLATLLVLASAVALLLLGNQLDQLRGAARALAAGDLSYQVNTARLLPLLQPHGEDLNAAAGAMNKAVNARLKSERMKTELITNVSHDIKTPLTSIINYVDLLKKAEPGSPQTAEYFEVLERQTQRLKKLTEDVVEASKAATGNITANLLPTNVDELLQQAAGEYEERLGQAQLPLVLNSLPLEARIMADGRLLSRVFDNLFANVAKYAQPQTRVYLGARLTGDNMLELSLKNVSREPLNLSPDELVERFVRGDSSRGSEGSGLGLSIAQSLTELQGGRFEIKIDGDLFTAVLLFPVL